jgi:hypothetical protein
VRAHALLRAGRQVPGAQAQAYQVGQRGGPHARTVFAHQAAYTMQQGDYYL